MVNQPRYVPRATQKVLTKQQPSDVVILENPNVSVSKSMTFMKQLTSVALSTILYLRDVLPADAFASKKLAGQQVSVLQGSEEIPSSRTIIKWIKSAFELVQSHHLKKLLLVIQKDSVTLEVYTFSFSYNHQEIHYDVFGGVEGEEVLLEQSQGLPEDVAKAVRQLLRCIIAHSSTLKPLPTNCDLSIKIFVDDDTPKEVVSELFSPSPDDHLLGFPAEVETWKLGKIETKFMTLGVSSKSVMSGENNLYGCENQEDVEPVIDLDFEDEFPSSQMESLRISSLGSSKSQNHTSENRTKDPEHDSSTTNLSEKLSVVSLKERTINCVCECSELLDETIKCISCSTYQHKICYKMLESHQDDSHICVNCHNADQGKPCSVPELVSDANRKESALFRQALMYCNNSSQVSCKRLMTHLKVPRQMAEKLFQRLDTDGCLEPSTNSGYVRSVKLNFQENILKHYFDEPKTNDNPQMEIPDSQEFTGSPISLSSQDSECLKRQLSQDIDIFSPEKPPEPKRRKILRTVRNLKKPLHW